MRGGFVLRATISSVPFLLPLMFQVGFGMDVFHSGALVLAVFAGNLAMKPATTPLIRYFGFKKLLIGNGILCAFFVRLCAVKSRDATGNHAGGAVFGGIVSFNAIHWDQFVGLRRCSLAGNEFRQHAFQHLIAVGQRLWYYT